MNEINDKWCHLVNNTEKHVILTNKTPQRCACSFDTTHIQISHMAVYGSLCEKVSVCIIRIIQNELYEINQEIITYTHTYTRTKTSRQKTIKVQQYLMKHVEQCQNCQ